MPAAVSQQAWWRVADHGLARKAFDDEASELVEVDHIFELDRRSQRCR